MKGPIPKDFGRFMPNLTSILINHNFFNGTLPDGLCQGNKLQGLNVGNNQLGGAIPLSLARRTTLTMAGLNNNRFTSTARNQLTGKLPSGLGANSKLTELDLNENSIAGDILALEFSQLVQNLSPLKLAKNNFIGEIPSATAMCNLMFQVDLSHNFFIGAVPPTLANLSKLEMLQLQGNNLLEFNPSMYSSWATTLCSLTFAENPWNAPIATKIGSLTMLQNLYLSYGGHIGLIPSELEKLTQLEVLDLPHNNLTEEVPSKLGQSMTSLILVNISFNCLKISLPPTWMKHLYANPNSFHGNPGLCLEYNASTNVYVSETLVGKDKLSTGVIVVVAVGGALALVIIVAFLFWWHRPVISKKNPTSKLDDVIVKTIKRFRVKIVMVD